MFLRWDLLDWIVVEVKGGMSYILEFGGENDLMSRIRIKRFRIRRVRIKTHFPLERPVADFPKIVIKMSHWSINIANYGKEGSIIWKGLSICWQIIRKVININKNSRKYDIFFKRSEKMVFSKRAVLVHDLSCIFWEDGIFFPKTLYSFLGRKVRDGFTLQKYT